MTTLAGDGLLSRIVNWMIATPAIYNVMKFGARSAIKSGAERQGVDWDGHVAALQRDMAQVRQRQPGGPTEGGRHFTAGTACVQGVAHTPSLVRILLCLRPGLLLWVWAALIKASAELVHGGPAPTGARSGLTHRRVRMRSSNNSRSMCLPTWSASAIQAPCLCDAPETHALPHLVTHLQLTALKEEMEAAGVEYPPYYLQASMLGSAPGPVPGQHWC